MWEWVCACVCALAHVYVFMCVHLNLCRLPLLRSCTCIQAAKITVFSLFRLTYCQHSSRSMYSFHLYTVHRSHLVIKRQYVYLRAITAFRRARTLQGFRSACIHAPASKPTHMKGCSRTLSLPITNRLVFRHTYYPLTTPRWVQSVGGACSSVSPVVLLHVKTAVCMNVTNNKLLQFQVSYYASYALLR